HGARVRARQGVARRPSTTRPSPLAAARCGSCSKARRRTYAVSNKTDRTARSRVSSLLLSGARPFAVALAAALLGACAQGSPADEPEQAGAAAEADRFAGIHQEGDVLGSPDAPLTLEEFSDLRCSHCRDFVDHTLPVLLDKYVRPGRL